MADHQGRCFSPNEHEEIPSRWPPTRPSWSTNIDIGWVGRVVNLSPIEHMRRSTSYMPAQKPYRYAAVEVTSGGGRRRTVQLYRKPAGKSCRAAYNHSGIVGCSFRFPVRTVSGRGARLPRLVELSLNDLKLASQA